MLKDKEMRQYGDATQSDAAVGGTWESGMKRLGSEQWSNSGPPRRSLSEFILLRVDQTRNAVRAKRDGIHLRWDQCDSSRLNKSLQIPQPALTHVRD